MDLATLLPKVIGSVEGPIADSLRHPRRHTIVGAAHRLDRLGTEADTVLVTTGFGVEAEADPVDRIRRVLTELGLRVEALEPSDLRGVLGIPETVPVLGVLTVTGHPTPDAERAVLPDIDEFRSVLRFDRFGVTADRGLGREMRFDDGWGYAAEIDVGAGIGDLWSLVTDPDLPSRFSDEATGATWDGPERGIGATFTGRNENSYLGAWEITCFVDRCDEPDGERAAFGWVTMDRDDPGATWRFELASLGEDRTRIRHRVTIGPGPSGLTMAIDAMPDREPRIVAARLKEFSVSMQRTVAGIAALAEEAS